MKQNDTNLGPLQQEVLEYIWANPGCCVRDCVDTFRIGGKEYAYTTLQTIFDVLYRKKLVSRRKKKNSFYYTPKKTRSELMMQRLSSIFDVFRAGEQPVASFLLDTWEQEDPQQLKHMIDELRQRGHIE